MTVECGMTLDLNEQAIVEGYAAGKSLRDLAAEHGVSTRPIRRILVQSGVERRPAGVRGPDRAPRRKRAGVRRLDDYTPVELQEMAARFDGGETQRSLAEHFN